LLPDSPAIGTGRHPALPALDQRGVPRVQGAKVDIGALESDRLVSVGFNRSVRLPTARECTASRS
jgi:hypothetical protein